MTLAKIIPDAPDLPLPYKGFQMILRPLYLSAVIAHVDYLNNTERGSEGFGSSDKFKFNNNVSSSSAKRVFDGRNMITLD